MVQRDSFSPENKSDRRLRPESAALKPNAVLLSLEQFAIIDRRYLRVNGESTPGDSE